MHLNLTEVTGKVTLEKDEWDRLCGKISAMERSFTELKDDLRRVVGARRDSETGPSGYQIKDESVEPDGPRYVRAMEINEQSHLTGERVHLGGGSVPALVMALQNSKNDQPAIRDVLGNSVLPLFGLDNESATYPFIDLWGFPGGNVERIQKLSQALPNDSACLEYVIAGIASLCCVMILTKSAQFVQVVSRLCPCNVSRCRRHEPTRVRSSGIPECTRVKFSQWRVQRRKQYRIRQVYTMARPAICSLCFWSSVLDTAKDGKRSYLTGLW